MFRLLPLCFTMAFLLFCGKMVFAFVARMVSMQTLWVAGFVLTIAGTLGAFIRCCQLQRGTTYDTVATLGLCIAYAGAALFLAAYENRPAARHSTP